MRGAILGSDGWIVGATLIPSLVIGVCAIVAYFMAISLLVNIARSKDPSVSGGVLWFVGIFLTPVLLALIVIAMPQRH